MTDNAINQDMANDEFDRFMENMDLEEPRDSESKESFDGLKYIMIGAIMNGSLVFEDDTSEPVFTPRRTKNMEPITFREPKGADFMAMDKIKSGQDTAKIHALAASMTGQPPVRFANLVGSDYKTMKAIVTLFIV